MNEQILSLLRTIVQSGASALSAKGLLDQEGETVLVAFIMWLIPSMGPVGATQGPAWSRPPRRCQRLRRSSPHRRSRRRSTILRLS